MNESELLKLELDVLSETATRHLIETIYAVLMDLELVRYVNDKGPGNLPHNDTKIKAYDNNDPAKIAVGVVESLPYKYTLKTSSIANQSSLVLYTAQVLKLDHTPITNLLLSSMLYQHPRIGPCYLNTAEVTNPMPMNKSQGYGTAPGRQQKNSTWIKPRR